MKLHLIWDMDGTLVDSEPEILATIGKALQQCGISIEAAQSPLRIGPPLPEMLRHSFSEEQLDDHQIDEVIKHFRVIYDSSEFQETVPFEGIDEMIHSSDYVHHVITNKPDYATKRILEKKGWGDQFVDVFSPDSFVNEMGRKLNKTELFQLFRTRYPDVHVVGIGDMAKDAACAKTIGIPAIGVLWGTGTKEELQNAGCDEIVSHAGELEEVLKKYY